MANTTSRTRPAEIEPAALPPLETPLPEVAGERITHSMGQIVINHFPSRRARFQDLADMYRVDRSVIIRVALDRGLASLEAEIGVDALSEGRRKARRSRGRVPKS